MGRPPKEKSARKAGTKGDIEGVKESKDQSGGGFSWNFDDYKIKETRGENYI
ncbi:Hypothetical protein FKW44_010477 [Caligus rogercresseyi]|uniref:Uncharacterized protein n=1 Tax=Caligus rogercresseyi TaxID=217165 RepID=A0A7T8HGL5_CALRO|nr:Hypothetical protein FKW44_010477 [Caligus rogercresseyi]